MQSTSLEILDKQDANVIYTKDMMDYEINVYGTEEEPLFLMRDVNNWLESNSAPTQLGRLVDDEDKVFLKVDDLKGVKQNQMFITEDGLYEICMRSNLPKAKKVRKFIKNILKELRTQGIVTTTNNNNSEIVSAMTMIAQSLQPMQQALVSIQEDNMKFRGEVILDQQKLYAKTEEIENTLGYLRIDGYELRTLTTTMAEKRELYRDYFEQLSLEYDARDSQIAKVWDSVTYSGMYSFIGKVKIRPFDNKTLHCNQSIKDITKNEYKLCLEYIKNYTLEKDTFEDRIKENYGFRNKKNQIEMDL